MAQVQQAIRQEEGFPTPTQMWGQPETPWEDPAAIAPTQPAGPTQESSHIQGAHSTVDPKTGQMKVQLVEPKARTTPEGFEEPPHKFIMTEGGDAAS